MTQQKTKRPTRIKFADAKLLEAYFKLKAGRAEELKLYQSIEGAIKEIEADPLSGIKIPRQVWPKKYIREYNIRNLWKHNLSDAWRLIYTLEGTEVEIVAIILEWFPHKEYEKHFKYKVG